MDADAGADAERSGERTSRCVCCASSFVVLITLRPSCEGPPANSSRELGFFSFLLVVFFMAIFSFQLPPIPEKTCNY